VNYEEVLADALAFADTIKKMTADVAEILDQARIAGDSIMFEGAQGTLLDIDHGTYPYVTSSNPTAGGVCTGAGIGPVKIDDVIGVAKAYITRVGEGPFPTELTGDVGEKLRKSGNEYGVTTGRPRRCGWLDLPILKHAVRVNGLTEVVLTKLDILSGFAEIKICIGYKNGEKLIKEIPANFDKLKDYQPVYESFPGWEEDISEIREYKKLPQNARDYVKRIEDMMETPIKIIGVGPKREEAIIKN
jgi:adenylosuccinate synthase